MKRLMSIILCLTMLFVMAAVPVLASETDGGQWVTFFSEDFTNRTGEPFDANLATPKECGDNVKAYIWYGKSSTVTNAVAAYEGNNALKITRTGSGDKRILFEFNEHLSGQIEISCRMLATAISSKGAYVEVVGEKNGEFVVDTSGVSTYTHITGTYYQNNALKTGYNGNNAAYSNSATWNANEWLNVKYVIDTETGNVTATYSSDSITEVDREITGTAALPKIVGIAFRSAGSNAFDVYVDDIVVKYFEKPAAAESEFDFSKIANGNASEAEVTKALSLPAQYTDNDRASWNIAWSSSDASVINPQTGAVNPAEVDKEITLTATFTGSKTFTKTFTLTVPALLSEFDFSAISQESVNGVTSNLNLIDTFTDDVGCEWAVDWSSSDENIINSETGAVTAGGIDERVELTASLTDYADGTESERIVTRTFNVKVLAAGSYHINEGFDAAGDYSGHNGIKDYTGDSIDWGISSNVYGDNSNEKIEYMNAHISTDPENSADKVLKFHRITAPSDPKAQRVWTKFNENTSSFNDKVYVGMRVLREINNTPTDIYAYAADGTRLMYIRFYADNSLICFYNSDLKSKATVVDAVPSGEWFDVTIELDMKNGSYSIYINGEAKQTSLAMAPTESGFGGLMFELTKSTEESIIYFDDLTVRTTDGFPYSIVEYNFVDADGYPTKSMVEGGKFKSIDMRKMSAVDAGTEPTLYIGLFKDEVLYDVISAPIDENGSLGGFEVVLNEALPASPLDYNVKAFVFSKDLVPLMNPSTYAPFPVIPTIFATGDSLGEERSAAEYPQSGYIQELSAYFDEDEINIENHAISGRSSKSYYDEGSLDKVLAKMYSGDYLFIQFGHNDEKGKGEYRETDPSKGADEEGSYKWYLMKYIQGARDRGATPVLIAPTARNSFVDGELKDTRVQPYIDAMISLANAEGVALVDLNAGWKSFVEGEVAKNIDSRNFYACFYPNDARFVGTTEWTGSKYNVTSGSDYDKFYSCYVVNPADEEDTSNHIHHDGSHLNIYGARVAAKIIADSLAQSGLDLADSIVENRVAEYPWASYATFGEIKAR